MQIILCYAWCIHRHRTIRHVVPFSLGSGCWPTNPRTHARYTYQVHRLHRPRPNQTPPRPPRRRALSALHIQPWMLNSSHARRPRLPPCSPSPSNTPRWTWTGPFSCTSSSFASSLEQYCWDESSHAVRNGATRSLWYNRRRQRVDNCLERTDWQARPQSASHPPARNGP